MRLLHGPGGQGKSRLAIQFGTESRRDGWTVLEVRHGNDHASGAAAADLRSGEHAGEPRGTHGQLLIVDYAERWPQQDLIDFLSDCREQEGRRVRVLLIARSAGGWWSTPTRHLTDWRVPFDDLALLPLEQDEGVDRHTLYARACEFFGSALGTQPPGRPRDLGADGFSTVLSVHMAALADTEAARRGELPPGSRAGISAYLIMRERDHWERLSASGRVSIGPDVFAQAVYTATLTGALPPAEALVAVGRIGMDSHEPAAKVIKDHAVAYPAHRFGTVLQPLHPDLLGEDFLALLLPTEPAVSPLSDHWAIEAPRRLITGDVRRGDDRDDDTPWAKSTLITLIETARRWEHVTTRQLVPLLVDRPRLFLQAGSAGIARLADNPWIPESVLDRFEAGLPMKDVELDAGAAVLTERLMAYRLDRAGDDAYARARLHRTFAHRLDGIGDYAKAAAEIRKDLEIRRRFPDMDDGQRAELAFGLDWAGIFFQRNGDRRQALEATSEAADIYRDLMARFETEDPELSNQYRRDLTYALANNAARWLPAGVRHELALEGVRHSHVVIGEGDPAQDGVELAGSLQNLGWALVELGRLDEALVRLEEAVAIRRVQTQRNFRFYGPLLDSALYALFGQYLRARALPKAHSVAEERVRVLRRLAEANEDLYGHSLVVAERHLRRLSGAAGPAPNPP
ncbi:tetratricopeptide repeat protein [Streptomyces sp. NPDC048604]|uniref:tetratricopeptide repeat protein n=1 Tax=Streptomyces sp. NPDC048604 TaxID=3365578 RepID=UPI0037231553